jgi:hypothetical protein
MALFEDGELYGMYQFGMVQWIFDVVERIGGRSNLEIQFKMRIENTEQLRRCSLLTAKEITGKHYPMVVRLWTKLVNS